MSDHTETIPTTSELLDRARAMVPVLRERAAEQEKQRKVFDETINDFQKAGFFRMLQPKRWGGYEMDPIAFYEVQMILAEGDMSSAWVFGVMGCHNFQMALFDDQAAHDVWSEDNSVLISSMFAPGGIAKPVEGGYMFNGNWRFSSGIDHAGWVFLGGSHNGEFYTCLVPKSEYKIVDTWHVNGLKATGSQDVVVDNIFIPEHRVHKVSDGFNCESPGNAVNTSPLYRLPFTQVFTRAITNNSIGGLIGMLDVFLEYTAGRQRTVAGVMSQDPDVLTICAEITAEVAEMKCTMAAGFAAYKEYTLRDEKIPVDLRLMHKYFAAASPDRCLKLATKLYKCCGSSGIFDTHPFGRIYNDILAAGQHAASQYQVLARTWGANLLGAENTEWYL